MEKAQLTFLFLLAVASSSIATENFSDDEKLHSKLAPRPIPDLDITASPHPVDLSSPPPVYLNVDSKGNIYSIQLTQNKSGSYHIENAIIPLERVAKIRSKYPIILKKLPDKNYQQRFSDYKLSTSACPLPSSFSLVKDVNTPANQQSLGSQKFLNTSRPPSTSTQWLVFDFFTFNFRGATHMVNMLFFKEPLVNQTLHGWGNILRDNHNGGTPPGSAGCGSASRFNSEVEAWYQVVPSNTGNTANWQSVVFNQTCGAEMFDGPVTINTGTPSEPDYQYFPRYRLELHANTSHWVAYRIWRFTGSNWVIHTPWKGVDVDSANWIGGSVNFDNNAEGILIAAVNAGQNWSFIVNNVQCGWF